MTLILDESIKPYLEDAPFERVNRLQGATLRDKEGRRTFQTQIGQRLYFVKHHRGIGWKEIFKDLTQLRLPTLSALNEYETIRALQELGIRTTNAVGIGVRGYNPAHLESFLITEAVENAPTLAEITAHWRTQPPSLAFKRALIQEVAQIARLMHTRGINHRDFYLCHFRLGENSTQEAPQLYLMDLHRAQRRRKTPRRWLIKDLGALLFSAADIGLSRTDILRFLQHYSGQSPSNLLRQDPAFWQAVYRRAEKFYQRDWKRPMPALWSQDVSA